MTLKAYTDQIGELVGKDDLKTALQQLHQLLKNSPQLDEAIIQSARYNDIMKQIRMGTINFEDANNSNFKKSRPAAIMTGYSVFLKRMKGAMVLKNDPE